LTTSSDRHSSPDRDIAFIEIDLSNLAGTDIVIFSEQTGGQPLRSKVIMVDDCTISVDRSDDAGRIDSLVNNQAVTMRFMYRGEPVAISGTLKKAQGGNCSIILEKGARPLALRKFKRFALRVPVKLAQLNFSTFSLDKIAKLRWLETNTQNLSAGGILLELTGFIETDAYLLLSIATEKVSFPSLLLGQVRYCLQSARGCYPTGVEFMTREMLHKRFEPALIKKLPQIVLEYDDKLRMAMSNSLSNYDSNDNS